MTLDERISTLKDLFKKREDIDKQIADLMNGGTGKKIRCGYCGEEGHNAKSCPKKQGAALSTPTPPAAPASPLTFGKL